MYGTRMYIINNVFIYMLYKYFIQGAVSFYNTQHIHAASCMQKRSFCFCFS